MTNIKDSLKKFFGFDTFKDRQEEIILSLMKGNNIFVLMPTGGGKSLCYQLPALLMEGTAIIVSPLIALMKNQVDTVRGASEDNGIAHFINSSLNKSTIDQVKEDIRSGRTKMLFVAPESLTKEDTVNFLRSIKISFYAIDEAHCISEWGHDFRPEYRKIRPIINNIGNAPVIALTATATEKVRSDIKKNLGIKDCLEFTSSFNRPNLYYEVKPKTQNIDKDIIRYILQHPGISGIIYCLSRKKVEELSEKLCSNFIKAAPYHAGLDAQTRNETQDAFLMEKIDVIVATIAFGMGIDKPDVRFVIHYDIPKSLEGYYQETGRAGRDGGEGQCIAFYSSKDLNKLQKFMEGKPANEQDIGKQLLNETKAYAESSMCRRKLLLHYFGENYREENCGNCDNCKKPKTKVEGKSKLCKVLEAIIETKENFKDEYIIEVLLGNDKNQDIIHNRHNDLECFGSALDEDDNETDLKGLWRSVIRQALIANYIYKDIDNYGILKVTPEGHKFLKHPTSFIIVKDRDFEEEEESLQQPQNGAECAVDPALYQMLKDLRKKMSKELKVPTYVIFEDSSLQAMATIYPITIDELQSIPRVGVGKAKKYGKNFCELIKHHCEENEIERPEDIRIRNVAKRSDLKMSIIKDIDLKVPLDDIADAKGLDYFDLLDEIDGIVQSGTHINIDYFIDEIIDEDIVLDIYDYFKESEANDLNEALEEAINELGDDYDEDWIRLVRIKFMSEMAN